MKIYTLKMVYSGTDGVEKECLIPATPDDVLKWVGTLEMHDLSPLCQHFATRVNRALALCQDELSASKSHLKAAQDHIERMRIVIATNEEMTPKALATEMGKRESLERQLSEERNLARGHEATCSTYRARIAKLEGERNAALDEVTKLTNVVEQLRTDEGKVRDELLHYNGELAEVRARLDGVTATVDPETRCSICRECNLTPGDGPQCPGCEREQRRAQVIRLTETLTATRKVLGAQDYELLVDVAKRVMTQSNDYKEHARRLQGELDRETKGLREQRDDARTRYEKERKEWVKLRADLTIALGNNESALARERIALQQRDDAIRNLAGCNATRPEPAIHPGSRWDGDAVVNDLADQTELVRVDGGHSLMTLRHGAGARYTPVADVIAVLHRGGLLP